LVAAGYGVDVLALRAQDGNKEYVLNGVNVRTISLGKLRGSRFRYLFEYAAFFFWVFWQLLLRVPRKSYAVIDVNTLPDFLIFAAAPAKLIGAKLVLDMHEITPEFYMSKYGIAEKSWTIRILTAIERLSFTFADHVITIHEPIENLLVGRGLRRSKSTIVMNAADEARFASRHTALLPSNQAGREKFVMVYHGTLTRIYGLDIAIEAFALVHEQMPGAEFWILGSGTEQAALALQIEAAALGSKVKLIGEVPGTEISQWLSKCDVGILPIRNDIFLQYAFPNKLPELVIMGMSAIISRLKAVRHYFSEEALAYFEPEDAVSLAEQMLALYMNPVRRRQLVDRAREEYAPIRWDVMRARYLKLIAALSGQLFIEPAVNHGDSKSASLAPSR